MLQWNWIDTYLVIVFAIYLMALLLSLIGKLHPSNKKAMAVWVTGLLVPLSTAFMIKPWALSLIWNIVVILLACLFAVLTWILYRNYRKEIFRHIPIVMALDDVFSKLDETFLDESFGKLNSAEKDLFLVDNFVDCLLLERSSKEFFSRDVSKYADELPDAFRRFGLLGEGDALDVFLANHNEEIQSVQKKEKISKKAFAVLDNAIKDAYNDQSYEESLITYIKEHPEEFDIDTSFPDSYKEQKAFLKERKKNGALDRARAFVAPSVLKHDKRILLSTILLIVISCLTIILHVLPGNYLTLQKTPVPSAKKVEAESMSNKIAHNGKEYYVHAYKCNDPDWDTTEVFQFDLVTSKNNRVKNEEWLMSYEADDLNDLGLEDISTQPDWTVSDWTETFGIIYFGVVPTSVQGISFDGMDANLVYRNIKLNGKEVSFKAYYLIRELNEKEIKFYHEKDYLPDAVVLVKEEGKKDTLVKPDFPIEDAVLYDNVSESILEKIDSNSDYSGLKKNLNQDEITFYLLDEFDTSVQSGGILSYLTDSSASNATHISKALKMVGLDDLADYYDSFLSSIDLKKLREDSDALEESDLKEQYNFDGFDDGYYELYESNNVYCTLIQFVKDHPSSFSND